MIGPPDLRPLIAANNSVSAESLNDLFATLHARSKDTPAKTFWHAEAMHAAIFRALRMSSDEEGAVYAAAAFRLHRTEAGPRILCAFPAPRILDEGDADWLGIETVLSWDPVKNTAEVMGDPVPQIVGAIPDGPLTIHASPFAYLRALAEARAQWFVMRRAVRSDWRVVTEPDLSPGLLLIGGDPAKVRWPIHAMPADITCHGIDARALNNAMLRQARIPRAVSAPTPLRNAA